MAERVSTITKDTLIPLAFVISIAGIVWFAASSSTRATVQIENHERRISVIEDDIRAIRDGVQRIEKAVAANHRETQEAKGH